MRISSLFMAEIRRHFLYEGINRFFLFSIIFWPILSFIQLIMNFKIFPIDKLQFLGIHNQKDLFYYMFIGYIAFVVFQTIIQSAWNFSTERTQGTLSQIFIAPINKLFWLYSRTISIVLVNGWSYFSIFIVVNLWYTKGELIALGITMLSLFLLLASAVVWGAFIMVFFVVMRDGTILFVILEGPQETFSGVKSPVQVMPKYLQIIAGIFPLTYMILLLRELLITKEAIFVHFTIFLLINVLLIFLTVFLFLKGEKHMRRTGNFELY